MNTTVINKPYVQRINVNEVVITDTTIEAIRKDAYKRRHVSPIQHLGNWSEGALDMLEKRANG